KFCVNQDDCLCQPPVLTLQYSWRGCIVPCVHYSVIFPVSFVVFPHACCRKPSTSYFRPLP
ncbi:hypothetical protein GOODEAATRI_007788, partial [Goodea atripinnis]